MRMITPNISIRNCEEALEFYKGIFGGEVKNLQKADGIEMFKGHEGKIIHSELHINENCILYFVDNLGNKSDDGNINIILHLESKDEIENIYENLTQGGKIIFPLQKTFWGAYHGVIKDKYGVTWGLNYAESK